MLRFMLGLTNDALIAIPDRVKAKNGGMPYLHNQLDLGQTDTFPVTGDLKNPQGDPKFLWENFFF